jgi:hypothetical protein
MAIPRVFVSSTFYDLKYIRENLKYFIKSLGYEPILSEEGSVYFDPKMHTQDACLAEVPNCQMLVLIIGGRSGSNFKETSKSITNAEYHEAVRAKIPIFALVEQAVINELSVYSANKNNLQLSQSIHFPSVDNMAIFDFIDEVRANSINNALVPFRDFAEIESYLKQQWAGMMFSFLTSKSEALRVEDSLEVTRKMSERIEMLSRQILQSVGNDETKMIAAMYDEVITDEVAIILQQSGCTPNLETILKINSFKGYVEHCGKQLTVQEDNPGMQYTRAGDHITLSKSYFDKIEKGYFNLCTNLRGILQKYNKTEEDFLINQKNKS